MDGQKIGLLAELQTKVDESSAEDARKQIERTISDDPVSVEVESEPETRRRAKNKQPSQEFGKRAYDERLKDMLGELGAGDKARGTAGKLGGAAKRGAKFGGHVAMAKILRKMGLPVTIPSTSVPGMLGRGGGDDDETNQTTSRKTGGGNAAAGGSDKTDELLEGSETGGGAGGGGSSASEPDAVIPLLQEQLAVQEEILEVLEERLGQPGGGGMNFRTPRDFNFGGKGGLGALALMGSGAGMRTGQTTSQGVPAGDIIDGVVDVGKDGLIEGAVDVAKAGLISGTVLAKTLIEGTIDISNYITGEGNTSETTEVEKAESGSESGTNTGGPSDPTMTEGVMGDEHGTNTGGPSDPTINEEAMGNEYGDVSLPESGSETGTGSGTDNPLFPPNPEDAPDNPYLPPDPKDVPGFTPTTMPHSATQQSPEFAGTEEGLLTKNQAVWGGIGTIAMAGGLALMDGPMPGPGDAAAASVLAGGGGLRNLLKGGDDNASEQSQNKAKQKVENETTIDVTNTQEISVDPSNFDELRRTARQEAEKAIEKLRREIERELSGRTGRPP